MALDAVSEDVICLDSGVWIKFLTDEGPIALKEAAVRLATRALNVDRVVAPAFAWAEVGSVLRKKARHGEILVEEAEILWSQFGALPIEFRDSPAMRQRAWELSSRYRLPTLYDAAFLACTEVAQLSPGAYREFWTTDKELIRSLGDNIPPYVRELDARTLV